MVRPFLSSVAWSEAASAPSGETENKIRWRSLRAGASALGSPPEPRRPDVRTPLRGRQAAKDRTRRPAQPAPLALFSRTACHSGCRGGSRSLSRRAGRAPVAASPPLGRALASTVLGSTERRLGRYQASAPFRGGT